MSTIVEYVYINRSHLHINNHITGVQGWILCIGGYRHVGYVYIVGFI